MQREADVLVIGAGPGGYPAAIRASQLGKKVIVVEKEFLGGVCNHVGCIPSKALISASKLYRKIHEAAEIGITASGVKLDWAKLQAWKKGVVKRLSDGVGNLLKGNKVDVVWGTARLTGANTAEVRLREGATETIRFKDCILAAGSAPIEIPGFKPDGKRIVTSTEALEFAEVPKRLIIIGAGAIGLEIACFYANFGTKVTVIELMPQVLPGVDTEVARYMERTLRKRGIEYHLEAKAKSATVSGTLVKVSFEVGGKPMDAEADHCLVAVGRRALAANLGLEAAGVKLHAKGWVEVNNKMQTNVPHIYAIGDLVGAPQLAHKASKEGLVAAEVICGKPALRDFATVPGVIFADPEISSAGLTEDEARNAGHEVGVGKFPFAASGRAITAMETDGFTKIVFEKKTHLVLGVHIIGPEASDLISEAALALEMGATIEDLAWTVHPHPTLGEAMAEAAEDAEGFPVHTMKRPA
ncbi:MAG TPA: dihydrolipoyl dehydrogenase [Candidatus Thermoplasmatota archaeon]|nr:dihydrolipoyl dehydrogenase [Candidatus Thermoplasmatota archaeon]